MSDRKKFHIVHGTKPPDTPVERVRARLRKSAKPPLMIQCHRCAGREIIESRIGAFRKNGKVTGGTKQVLCVACLMRGERVVLA